MKKCVPERLIRPFTTSLNQPLEEAPTFFAMYRWENLGDLRFISW